MRQSLLGVLLLGVAVAAHTDGQPPLRAVAGSTKHGGDAILIATGPTHPYRLTSVENGVWFDIDGDGTPEQTVWMAPGDDSAFLAIDRNGNGIIDNGSELVSDHIVPGHADSGFDGLIALAELNGGTGDGALTVLDTRHPLFRQLLLWQDGNHNGVSESNEIMAFGDAFKSINLNYDYTDRVNRNGNPFSFKGFVTTLEGVRVQVFNVSLKALK